MSKSPRSGLRTPIILNDIQDERSARRDRVFGGPMPAGPLPGPLLVQLSRLHRAEGAKAAHAPASEAEAG